MLVIKLKTLLPGCEDFSAYTNLQGFHSNESPQETIPLSILVTCQPDIVIYNKIPLQWISQNLPEYIIS